MKTLFLLRHAKSSWDDPGLRDFERPLNERGLEDVPRMASRFQARHQSLCGIICSPAIRAKTTAMLFAENINFPAADIISNPELYFAGTGTLLKATTQIDETCNAAMLVGHNPAITEFANAMGDSGIDNIPTCGMVELSLPVDSWANVQLGEATLVHFDYPKKSPGP